MKSIILFILFTYSITITGSDDKENITRFANNVMPTLGCWYWGEKEFQPDGYKQFIDQVSRHSSYDLLTTSIRAFEVGKDNVIFDALGVAAVRLDDNGNMKALAAGGLSYFKAGDFEIRLNTPTDIALWQSKEGKWVGVLQGGNGDIPLTLLNITDDWIRLDIPLPLENE